MRRLHLFVPLVAAAALAMLAGPRPSPAADNDAGTLSVRVQGLESTEGKLRFVIFDSKKSFLKKPVRAEVLTIAAREVTWTVDELTFGTYAVLVHHDIDGNGKMDRHWYGKPKEPTGTSNNPPARMGPPLWKKASFDFSAATLMIEITIN